MKCKKCKNEIPKGSNYCTNCGNKIDFKKRVINTTLSVIVSIYICCGIIGWINAINKNKTNTIENKSTSVASKVNKNVEEKIKLEPVNREQLKKEGENNFITIKKAYDNNEISASNTYKGNTYTLYGKVVGVSESGVFNSLLGTIGITIEIKKDGEYFYAFCSFPKAERDKLSNINKGDYLLFEGKCYSWGNYDECKVI